LSCLSKIASPDATGVSATDLGVVVGSEDISVTGLATISPAFAEFVADAVEAGEVGPLAEPAANEAPGELVGLSGSKDLTEGTGEELVDHLAIAVGSGLEGIGFEGGVMGKLLEAQLCAPLLDNAHVAVGLGGFWCWRWGRSLRRRSGSFRGRSRSRSFIHGGRGGSRNLYDLGRGSRSRSRSAFNDGGVDDLGARPGPMLLDDGRLSRSRSIAIDDDGDDSGLVDDLDFVDDNLLVAITVRSGEGGAGKGENRESLDGVHGD